MNTNQINYNNSIDSITYTHQSVEHCWARLPCGHCKELGYMCPYYTQPSNYDITCESVADISKLNSNKTIHSITQDGVNL